MYTESLTSRHSGISNDVLLFSDIGLSLVHHYRVHKRGLPHIAFRRNYLKQLCALLPLPTVLSICLLDSAAESPDVVCASPRPSRRAIRRRRPVRVMDSPVLTEQDPLAEAGAQVFDCRPPLLPVSMDISGVDVSVIWASAVSAEAAAFPPEREQSFGGGGGGDLLSLICPELGVAPLVDPGTDLEDELPTPATSPVTVDHGAAPRPTQVELDVDLDRVFQDVATLPEMVTPYVTLRGARCDCGGVSGALVVMMRPLVVPSPAGPADMDHVTPRSLTGSVDCSSALPLLPVVSTPEGGQSSRAAPDDNCHLSSSSLFGGEPAGRPLPPVSLTPRPTGAFPHVGDSDADGGRTGVPDLSLEGPFDVHQDRPHSGASPRFLDGGQGCQFRMTSYDEEHSGPDFSRAYEVQLHDPRLLEYVGAPESARSLTRSPEYWLHHMGRENTLSAALQLQHDAGLILSNVQVLQQLVTALNRTSSDVMRVVHDRRPFPTDAMQQVVPTYRVRGAAHYMTALGLWRPPTTPEIRGPLPLATCNACMSCSD